jgi:hypothetical protein
MSAYTMLQSGVLRASDGAFIPSDPANTDWQMFQAWLSAGGVPDPYVAPPAPPQAVLPQHLMAQFTADDAAAIQSAISGNVQFWLLWQAMTAQKDPMVVTNARFLAGWNALVQVLGQARMDAIATALGVTIG